MSVHGNGKRSMTLNGESRDPAHTRLIAGSGGNVLLLSMRRLADLVAFAQQYEFEDVIAELTGADRVEVGDHRALELSRRVYKLARLVSGSRRLASSLAPDPHAISLSRDYELFFPVFNSAYELYALASIRDWRARCRRAVCFVSELWVHNLPDYLLELLSEFDHIFIGVSHPAQEVARIVGRPCTYLPWAADVLRFTPLLQRPERVIDVCNIGRRSDVTHAALLRLASEQRIFYYYDTIAAGGHGGKQRTFRVHNPREHRLLLSSLLKRSRYFIANRSRINEPEFTQGRDEIAGRFYEGAAAGALMLGEQPRTEEFDRQFGWPDALVPLPFDSTDVEHVLAKFDNDVERAERIRTENARQSALRHDWVHRLRTVYETVGLAPTEAMRSRESRLAALAAISMPAPAMTKPQS
jgi:Glycosyl transferases group 1